MFDKSYQKTKPINKNPDANNKIFKQAINFALCYAKKEKRIVQLIIFVTIIAQN